MKILQPKYAENIIVGVNSLNGFRWYLTPQDIWILDIYKYQKAYKNVGYDVDLDYILSLRNNIAVVDEDNYQKYLQPYESFSIETEVLNEWVLNNHYDDTILSLQPSLYVDFINNELISEYPEAVPYEKYVPDGWKGKTEGIAKYIEKSNQYWMDNDIDLISKKFNQEKRKFEEMDK
ncbi:hypothetical protein ACYSNR_00495 [Enterococcus sp. LJL128]